MTVHFLNFPWKLGKALELSHILSTNTHPMYIETEIELMILNEGNKKINLIKKNLEKSTEKRNKCMNFLSKYCTNGKWYNHVLYAEMNFSYTSFVFA